MSFSKIYIVSEPTINNLCGVLHSIIFSNKIIVKAGSYNGDLLNAAQVAELASIPSRDELLAKLLGIMQAPVSGFARCLAALAEKKQEEAAA